MEIINATGRRKTAVARVFVKEGTGNIVINGKDYKEYFPTLLLQHIVEQPFLEVEDAKGKFDVKINLGGGGPKGQAEAVRLGISRALVKINEEWRLPLKQKGYLTRDPRVVERKKYGRKKARKQFQFSKR
jgi:small subunit ribosomal protein S9